MRRPSKRPVLLDHRGRPMAATPSPQTAAGGYESGSRARRLSAWLPYGSGPNSAYQSDLSLIRARSRHEIRNNSIATSAKATFTSDAVGTGIVPRWKLENRELAEALNRAWDRWVDESDADERYDFYGQQMLAAGTMFESGEVLARRRPRRLSDGLSVPLQIQLLEPDYLDSSKDGDHGNVHHRQGVEFNSVGKRTAYWLHRFHPGDGSAHSIVSHRVPASEVIHCYRVDRPGAVRGVPWLAPVLVKLHGVDRYEDAELLRKQIAAMFAGFIKKPVGDGVDPEIGVAGNEESDEDRSELTLEPGTMSYLEDGEDIVFSTPGDVGSNYEVFLKNNLRSIAAGIGTTYEQLTKDLSGVNYSSIRAGILDARRRIEMIQHNILVFQFCRQVMHWWLDLAVASGAVTLPGYYDDPTVYRQVDWLPAAFDWVDPTKDIKATTEANLAGIMTREEAVAKRGVLVEDLDATNARDVERQRRLGLKYTTYVGADREGGPASVQSRSQGEQDDELEDERQRR